MTLNGVMAVTLRYFTEFVKPVFQSRRSVAEFMHESIVVCVRCRRKASSRSLSHLLSFLLVFLLVHSSRFAILILAATTSSFVL